jgi:hypothetical protein
MANSALAVLESALRDKKLDRTLTTALPPMEQPAEACAQTGMPLSMRVCGTVCRGASSPS